MTKPNEKQVERAKKLNATLFSILNIANPPEPFMLEAIAQAIADAVAEERDTTNLKLSYVNVVKDLLDHESGIEPSEFNRSLKSTVEKLVDIIEAIRERK